MIPFAWLLLILAVAVLLLAVAALAPLPTNRFLAISAAVLSGVVTILAILRLAD